MAYTIFALRSPGIDLRHIPYISSFSHRESFPEGMALDREQQINLGSVYIFIRIIDTTPRGNVCARVTADY